MLWCREDSLHLRSWRWGRVGWSSGGRRCTWAAGTGSPLCCGTRRWAGPPLQETLCPGEHKQYDQCVTEQEKQQDFLWNTGENVHNGGSYNGILHSITVLLSYRQNKNQLLCSKQAQWSLIFIKQCRWQQRCDHFTPPHYTRRNSTLLTMAM